LPGRELCEPRKRERKREGSRETEREGKKEGGGRKREKG